MLLKLPYTKGGLLLKISARQGPLVMKTDRILSTQTLERRDPKRGDARDALHSLTVAAIDNCVFVTHDEPLRRVVASIPGLDLEVLDLRELRERLR